MRTRSIGLRPQRAFIVYGFNGTLFDAGEVTYPQPISFCETCHVSPQRCRRGRLEVEFECGRVRWLP